MLQPMDYKESDTAKQMNNNGSGRVKRKNKELLGGGDIQDHKFALPYNSVPFRQ